MKKITVLFLFLTNVILAQDDINPFTSNTNDPNTSGEKVHLYDIEIDGLKIPLEISYNHEGFKAMEAPGIVGLGWVFHDIGKITRKINHLPDDYNVSYYPPPESGGWFFNNNNQIGFTGVYYSYDTDYSTATAIKGTIDTSPDFYNFNSSFGKRALFTFDKTVTAENISLTSLFLDTNENFILDFNVNNFHYGVDNFQDVVFDLHEENGFTYSFIGGPSNTESHRSGIVQNQKNKDFYISKITSNHSTDEITISYEPAYYEAICLGIDAYKTSSMTYAVATYGDYYFKGESRLITSEIITPKEKIIFEYSDYIFIDYPSGDDEILPKLDAIYIKNLNDEIITSFHFVYSEWIDYRPLLTKIYQGEKGVYYPDAQDFYDPQGLDLMNVVKIKEFEYYDYTLLEGDLVGFSPNFAFTKIDAYGYYNGSNNNGLLPHESKSCSSSSVHAAANRVPDLSSMKQGVLKKSINNLGGTTEYDYQLNGEVLEIATSRGLYGGGLKISSITEMPDTNTTYTTTFEYSNLQGFTIDLNSPGYHMGNGSLKGYIVSMFEDEYQPQNTVNHYQTIGNFFGTVISKKFIKNVPNQDDSEIGDLYLKTKTTYTPNYKTLVRTPLTEKIEVFEEAEFTPDPNGPTGWEIPISKKEYTYGNISYPNSINANKIYTGGAVDCQGDYLGSNPSRVTIYNRPIYKIEMPLKEIRFEKYIQDDSGYSQTITSRQEFSYFGESDPNYALNVLRPKEVINYKNDVPVSKKKYKYMVEEFIPGAGLTNLTDFSTEDKTLLSNESNWVYEDGTWYLNSANFYEYLSDGKLSAGSLVIKSSLNQVYTESTFNPYYSGGFLSGVPLLNRVEYEYDLNGKIDLVKNIESGTFKKFYRYNDYYSPYLVNTVLEGNLNTPYGISIYRTSFENITGADYLETTDALTGKTVYAGTSGLNLGTYPIDVIVSYWYYKDNQWVFDSYIHTGGDVIISRPGADYIDEVWIRPMYTKLSGKVYNKYMESTHLIDDKGFIVKNVFDDFSRLIKQVDRDGNIINERTYNFTQE